MQERRVAFGLAATTVALKAKSGQLRMVDQLQFAMRAMDMVHDDVAALQAVRNFLTVSADDAPAAGEALQSFIIAWSDGQQDPGQSEKVLAALPDLPADVQTTETTAFDHERKLQ